MRAATSRIGTLEWLALLVPITALVITGEVVVAASLVALGLVWVVLADDDHPPVLRLALTFQWVQVSIGIFYSLATGRRIATLDRCDWRTMMWLGLGCLCTLAFGLRTGRRLVPDRKARTAEVEVVTVALSTPQLAIAYGALGLIGIAVPAIAFSFPALTQLIFSLSLVRYAALYLLFRRFTQPTFQPVPFVGVLVVEILLGVSGFYVGFREAFMLAGLSLLETFDRRRIAHWVALVLLALALAVAGVVWTGVKTEFRRDLDRNTTGTSQILKLERLEDLASSWSRGDQSRLLVDVDKMISRLWGIYYPALAIARVPSVLPHTDGELTLAGVQHVLTPRMLFPEKAVLDSDSEMVRKYSGVWVASTRQRTSIAFGYAAEFYVDFGVPLMFVPVFLFALALGAFHRYLETRIQNREIAIGTITAVFWTSLYLFERSWVRTLGVACTSALVLGALGLFADRTLARLLHRRVQSVRLIRPPS